MKSTGIIILTFFFCLSGISLSSLAAQKPQSGLYTVQEFPVGKNPSYFAFDGTNIWVSNSGEDSLTKLRASDGAQLGNVRVGDYPWYLTFDGSNIWSSDLFGGSVTKVRASDGARLGTFPGFYFPAGIVFDGSSIWVADLGASRVSKITRTSP